MYFFKHFSLILQLSMATTRVPLPLLSSSVDLCPTNGAREMKRIVEYRKNRIEGRKCVCITSGCACYYPSPLHFNLHHRQTYLSIRYLVLWKVVKFCGKHTAIIETENNSGHNQTIEIRNEELKDDCRVFYCGMTSRNRIFQRCSHFPAHVS